mgnify:CR=1 FL=1
MNESNFYNYSILTGVWNDLDYDVLKLVKEYLRVHLNRRLLHNDYDEFIERSKIYNPTYYPYNEKISEIINRDTIRNNIRYGFNSTNKFLKVIDDCRFGYKYYIFGTDLALDVFNISPDSPAPALRLIRKRFVKSYTDNLIDAVNSFSDRTIRDFIRTLMCVEEGLIEDKYTIEEACGIADSVLIRESYYIENDD